MRGRVEGADLGLFLFFFVFQHNDYDNNERKLFLIRTEIVRLIRATRENFSKSGITLAYSVRALEEFLSQPLIGVNLSDFTLDEKDQAILTCLQQHLGAIVQVFLQSLENQSEIRAALEDSRQEIMCKAFNSGRITLRS